MKIGLWKKGLVLGIILLFVGAGVIPSLGEATFKRKYSQNKNDVNQKTDSYSKGTLTYIKIKSTPTSLTIPTLLLKDSKLTALVDNFFINSNNIIVSNAKRNESYPSLVIGGNDGLVAYEYEDEGKSHIYIRNSGNYGQNWSDAIKIVANQDSNPDIETNSPILNLGPVGKKVYGVCKSPLKNSSVLGFFEIDNISSINNIITYTFEFQGLPDGDDPNNTYAFWGFKNPAIVTYKDTNAPTWVVVFIGTTNHSTYSCTNSLIFLLIFNPDPHQQFLALGWKPDIQNLSNLSLSRFYDSSTRYIHGVCEIKNGSNQDLFFFKIYFKSLYYSDNLYQILTSSENLTHPQIFIEENRIYIVADSDSSGIVLYSSSDDGNSWDINHVTRDILPPSANPNYPMLYADDKHLFCSFIESGNIYLTRSTDNGLNWSFPVQLNNEDGSVVEEYRFADFSDKHHVLWTDNREGNRDIYSDLVNFLPPSAPFITGPTRGKKGVSYDFTFNSLDPDGDDVLYYIDWGDGCKIDWNGPHASGVDFKIVHSFPCRKTFTIKAKAKDIDGSESNWTYFDIEIEKLRNKATPNLWYHWFLDRFPLLERLLNLVR